MKIIKEPFMRLEPEHFISVTFETEVKDADSVRELIEKWRERTCSSARTSRSTRRSTRAW